QERNEHYGSDGHRIPHNPEDDLGDPEPESEQRHEEAEGVEEHERVKVADHVLLPHAPEEALEQEPGDPRDDLPDLDAGAFADAVHRTRRDVTHPRVPDV